MRSGCPMAPTPQTSGRQLTLRESAEVVNGPEVVVGAQEQSALDAGGYADVLTGAAGHVGGDEKLQRARLHGKGRIAVGDPPLLAVRGPCAADELDHLVGIVGGV